MSEVRNIAGSDGSESRVFFLRVDLSMTCPQCGTLTVLEEVRLRLIPEGEAPIEVDAAEVRSCLRCKWMRPTEATRRRLCQLLGMEAEKPLEKPVRVQMSAGPAEGIP